MSEPRRNTLSRPRCIRLTLIIQLVLGCSAVGGGVMFIIAPDGSLMQMPVSLLQAGPFPDFLIPGLFLAVVLGGGQLVVAWTLWSHPQVRSKTITTYEIRLSRPWHNSLALSLLSILWIQIQAAIIGVAWLQAVVILLHLLVIYLLSRDSSMKYCRTEQ